MRGSVTDDGMVANSDALPLGLYTACPYAFLEIVHAKTAT